MLSKSRRAYSRPQAIVFSDKRWTFNGTYYEPPSGMLEYDNFLVLSDHNRSAIDMSKERIETRERMIDGSMRSYWVADKMKISTSWNLLPSRALPVFDTSIYAVDNNGEYTIKFTKALTVDAGAGGNELLEWYRRHQGSFYVLVAYDRFNVSTEELPVNPSLDDWATTFAVNNYQEQFEMFFSDFSYSVEKRNQDGSVELSIWEDTEYNKYDLVVKYDLWNVSMSLDEA